jgi:hypothetical protein
MNLFKFIRKLYIVDSMYSYYNSYNNPFHVPTYMPVHQMSSQILQAKVEVPKPARIRSFGASSRGFAINSRIGVLANGFQRC